MRLLVVVALFVACASAFPMGGGGYYGANSGLNSGYGGGGHMGGGHVNNGVFDQADSGFRRIEEGHNTRNFGASNNMGGMGSGGGGYGFNNAGNSMYGGGGLGGGIGGPMGIGIPPIIG